MPFSWLRVSSQPSPKVRDCMGNNTTKQKFLECADGLIRQSHGEIKGGPWFENNGKWAHFHVWTETCEQMNQIVLDLEAEEVELFTLQETQDRIDQAYEAD